MIFFEQHPAAEAQALMPIGERSGATEKKRCNCRIGMIQLNPIWSSPIETLSSFLQCTVTNETLLHAEINNVLMTHPVWNFATWHLPSTVELQTALCKEGNEQRRDKCLGHKWAAKVGSLSMLNLNGQAVSWAEYNVDFGANKCRWDRQPLGPVVF